MNQWLEIVIYHNSVLDYLITGGIVAALMLITRLFRTIIIRKLKRWSEKTATGLDDFIVVQIDKLALPILYGAGVYAALQYLTLSDTFVRILQSGISILLTFYGARFIVAALNFLLGTYWINRNPDRQQENIRGITGFISIIVWGLSIIFLLDNLGFKVSTIVAGLGIGGIAVALAAQAILGDLFSYFVIFFDRPFQIGDFIVVDDKVGAVEYIGIKTTRIRSLSGEELVFSNKDLTDSRIHNFKKMERRRVLFSLGVTYQTSLEKVREIPALVKAIIESQQDVTFDRAHFNAFGNSSLDFEIVYYVFGADYNKYMDIQQAINLKIYEEFDKRSIAFAYPTQTIYMPPPA